jgi:hypothetical protein
MSYFDKMKDKEVQKFSIKTLPTGILWLEYEKQSLNNNNILVRTTIRCRSWNRKFPILLRTFNNWITYVSPSRHIEWRNETKRKTLISCDPMRPSLQGVMRFKGCPPLDHYYAYNELPTLLIPSIRLANYFKCTCTSSCLFSSLID